MLFDWFVVRFDNDGVILNASPPNEEPWSQQFTWVSIEQIMFRAEDFTLSDGIYVFTKLRPESFVIPIEAQGGVEL